MAQRCAKVWLGTYPCFGKMQPLPLEKQGNAMKRRKCDQAATWIIIHIDGALLLSDSFPIWQWDGANTSRQWSLITSKQRPKPITKTHHDFSSHISLEGIALLSQLSRMRHQHAIIIISHPHPSIDINQHGDPTSTNITMPSSYIPCLYRSNTCSLVDMNTASSVA